MKRQKRSEPPGSGASIPIIDRLLAATAKVYGLTLVTRNVADAEPTGAVVLTPFLGEP